MVVAEGAARAAEAAKTRVATVAKNFIVIRRAKSKVVEERSRVCEKLWVVSEDAFLWSKPCSYIRLPSPNGWLPGTVTGRMQRYVRMTVGAVKSLTHGSCIRS